MSSVRTAKGIRSSIYLKMIFVRNCCMHSTPLMFNGHEFIINFVQLLILSAGEIFIHNNIVF